MLNLTIGIVGMIFILTAFILDEFVKSFNQNTIKYNLFNLFGAGLLSYYAYTLVAWPFLALNIIWLVVAGYKMVRILSKN